MLNRTNNYQLFLVALSKVSAVTVKPLRLAA
jgi:hypothetical protein